MGGFYDICKTHVVAGIPFTTTVQQMMVQLGLDQNDASSTATATCAIMGTDNQESYVVTPSTPRVVFASTSESNPAASNSETCLYAEVAGAAQNRTLADIASAVVGTLGSTMTVQWDNCCALGSGATGRNAAYNPSSLTSTPCLDSSSPSAFVGDCSLLGGAVSINVILMGVYVQAELASAGSGPQAVQDFSVAASNVHCTKFSGWSSSHTSIASESDGCTIPRSGAAST